MSTETPVIRNFTGLQKFEELAKQFRLVVNKGYGDVVELGPRESMTVGVPDLRDLGLTLRFDVPDKTLTPEMENAAKVADIALSAVDLVVVAESGFLRNREIVVREKLSDLAEKVEIVPWKGVRSDVLMDRKHGFDLNALFVLNTEMPVKPLRPRRLGTILANSYFTIRPNRIGSGLVPKPLTEEVRKLNHLPRGTVLFVDQVAELFDSETLDDTLSVYIDEDIHSDLGKLRTKEAKLLQADLAIQALGQLVYLASLELAGVQISTEHEKSPIASFLHAQLRKVLAEKTPDIRATLESIKSNPGVIAAQLTAQFRLREQLRNLMIMEEED